MENKSNFELITYYKERLKESHRNFNDLYEASVEEKKRLEKIITKLKNKLQLGEDGS